MAKPFYIGKKAVGPGHPVFIVAEMSGNHNQSFDRAKELIEVAKDAGVDAIKLQTYTADTLTIDSPKKWFQVKVNKDWAGKSLYKLYQEAHTPWQWQPKLKKMAEKMGLVLFSTPFDETAVDFLEKIKVPVYKVASFEIVDLELLKKIASTRKPVIVSRGMASTEEIKTALSVLKKNGAKDVALLHCVSSYPARIEDMNISTVPDLAKKFKVVSGLSDHSLGISATVASVALGASIIEKHYTFSRKEGGPDASFSLEPKELKEMVSTIREVEKAIGKPSYKIGKKEAENVVFRRSLFSIADIAKGETLTRKNIRCIRPGYGLEPKHLLKILGRKAKKKIEKGTPLNWSLV